VLCFSSVTNWFGRWQPSLFLPDFVADRQSMYVFVLAWFLWGVWASFLFFVHSGTYGLLSSIFLGKSLIADVEAGGSRGCLLPVN
jgi:hypothetical protein